MKILTAAVAAEAGSVYNVAERFRAEARIVRAKLAGTATVRLQGRMDENDAWQNLGTDFSATGIQSIQLMPQVRANVSAWTSGAVDMWVDARDA